MLDNEFVPQVVVSGGSDADESYGGVVDLLSLPGTCLHVPVVRDEQHTHPANRLQQVNIFGSERQIRDIGVTDPEDQSGIRV